MEPSARLAGIGSDRRECAQYANPDLRRERPYRRFRNEDFQGFQRQGH